MNIIVTGASRGIGFELVKKFSHSPRNRIIAISRNREKLEALSSECRALGTGSEVIIIPFDLSDPEEIGKVLKGKIQSHFNSLDILVNNAGYLVRKPFIKMGADEFRRCVDVNFLAPLFLIQSMLPLLRKSGEAHVINIGSMAGIQGSRKFPGLISYSASKGAIQIGTESLAEEFRDENIVFNSLALGSVRTEMLAEAFPDNQATVEAFEMAELIADFAVNGRRFYNGKTIQVSRSTP